MAQMKDSGIEWIGEIPNDWFVERLRFHILEINEPNNPIKTTNVLSLTNKLGVIPYEEKGAQGNVAKEDYSQYKIAYPKTIVVNSMNVLIGSVGVCNYFGCVSPVYYIFKMDGRTNLEFVNYIFQTATFQRELRKYANGILEIRLRVSSNNILKQKVAFPRQEEQINIVKFLNKKSTEIKSLIDNLNKQIELLKDYKKEIISETVTKGLDPNVPLKDSGIDWIGKIPENWEKNKLNSCVDVIMGQSPNSEDIKSNGNCLFMQGNKEFGEKYPSPTLYCDSCPKHSRIGDILLSVRAPVGAINESDKVYGIGRGLCSLKAMSVNKEYFKYFLMSAIDNLNYYSHGTTFTEITLNTLKNIWILLPPTDVQKSISDKLNLKCLLIDKLIFKKQQTIDKLNEYSKSLIYEYVTGKKEVI